MRCGAALSMLTGLTASSASTVRKRSMMVCGSTLPGQAAQRSSKPLS